MIKKKEPSGFGNVSVVNLCSVCRAQDNKDLQQQCKGSVVALSSHRLNLARQCSASKSEVV